MSWLISAAELAARCDGESHPRILDVRWTLATPDGRADYRAGHIPGAVYVDLDAELSDHAVGGAGRHPLPAPGALQAAARRWGLRDGDPVVVYDDWNALAAARCWWLLRSAGVRDVRVLDGGWSAWLRAGLPSETGEQAPAPGTVTLTPADPGRTVDADAAAAVAADPGGLLLDARAAARYRGDEEPLDPRAGHIPGAVSAPTTDNLNPEGTFRGAAELRERFAGLGVGAGPTAVYCGSGVTACHQILALAVAGHDAALFPGSWSQWSGEPARPIATGPQPG